ncbi:transcriptional regulator Spx [Enterococcus sp. JM4C]|uniref:transcriptional regulator Spx n=1 Tax=Candidatus Enterococcus huntleyi TaxID=1857217 RepID=UPI00137AE04C|nr:transcriptional regulator Spx [Enterococcus sp. JM4C]KAF1298124.1 transcriptional regulator Spx [Enterococcus sp. JM4C]
MIYIYTAPSCTSCRKAKAWLREQNLDFEEQNFFANPIGAKELKKILMLTENGTQDIISTRSKAYKKLAVDLDDLPLSEVLEIIEMNPSLLRRPIIHDDKRLQVGYNEEDIHCFVPRAVRNCLFLARQKSMYLLK